MLSRVKVAEYKNTGPVAICDVPPGGVVSAFVVPDVELLVGLGWLVPVESGTASSTMPKTKPSSQEKS